LACARNESCERRIKLGEPGTCSLGLPRDKAPLNICTSIYLSVCQRPMMQAPPPAVMGKAPGFSAAFPFIETGF